LIEGSLFGEDSVLDGDDVVDGGKEVKLVGDAEEERREGVASEGGAEREGRGGALESDSQNSSLPLENSVDSPEEETLSNVSIDSRERVVEENDLGVVVDESSDGNSLLLPEDERKRDDQQGSSTRLRKNPSRLTLPTS